MNRLPYILFISGPIGAGKTTVAEYIKKRVLRQTAFLDLDEIRMFLNKRESTFWLDPKKRIQHNTLSRLVMLDLIKSYVSREVNVVVSSTWKLKLLNLVRKRYKKKAVIIHLFLEVSLENAKKRVKDRKGIRKVYPLRLKRSYAFYCKQKDKKSVLIDGNMPILKVRKKVMRILKKRKIV